MSDMKRMNISVYFVMVLSLLMISCERENLFPESEMVEEGLPAEISLNFKSQENNIVSRAERDSVDEYRVNNVYLFIFNSDGDVHERKFCTPGNGLSYDPSSSISTGDLFVSTRSLNNAKIVGIANVYQEGISSNVFSITKENLDAIDTYDELNTMVMKMSENSIERYSAFLMTGYAKDTNGNTVLNIPPEASSGNPYKCNISLVRTDAKIKFEVSLEPKSTWTECSFYPKTWTVRNVPSQSYMMERESGDYDGEDAKYFSSPVMSFEELSIDEISKLYTGGSFVFYMPENRKEYKQSVSEYALRDAWNETQGIDDEGNRSFINANDKSTYVEMTGLLSYMESGKNTNADVRFIVHLGNTSNNNFNNYDTDRNSYYTYNVKIAGVEDIIVEVEQNREDRPGYEGDVVKTEKQAYSFDSHYDRCLITINPSHFAKDGKVYWSVNTPFSRGVYEIPAEGSSVEVPKELRDYRWVKFAVNKEYGVNNGEFVKYPGDQNYNDPYPMSHWKEGKDYNAPSPSYSGKPNARLLDINQFMEYIREQHDKGVNEDLTVSVFIDEYLYFKDPIENTEGENKTSLWKLSADKQDRILYLVIEEPKYSEDKQSSVAVAEYSFRQRTIQTIYNVDNPELKTAWGLESVMETERLEPGDVSKGTDTRNGRANCLKWLVGQKWTDIVKVSADQYELKSGYNNAAYACLLRNRDLNGDNVIDSNEIRWYLASIDQLVDIYLGEYALDEQSRLYPKNAADRDNMVRWHYTSSSYNQSEGAPWVLWAEEGASIGTYEGSSGYMRNKYNYRCVRNLGLSLNDPDAVPEDLIQVSTDGKTFDMTNMNVKARRTMAVTEPLPPHNEKSDINRCYAKFEVGSVNPVPEYEGKNGGYTYLVNESSYDETDIIWNNNNDWSYYQTNDNRKNGYRIPNQRELLVLATRLPKEKYPIYKQMVTWHEGIGGALSKKRSGEITRSPVLMSQTLFSLAGKEDYGPLRRGFMWQPGGNFFLENSYENKDGSYYDKGYLLLIKDIN